MFGGGRTWICSEVPHEDGSDSGYQRGTGRAMLCFLHSPRHHLGISLVVAGLGPQYKGTERRRKQKQAQRVCTRVGSKSSGTLSDGSSHGYEARRRWL